MSRLRRSLALLLASAVGLAAPLATMAHAAEPGPADRAAGWLATQVVDGALDDGFSAAGATADGLIALAAADDPALQPTIDAMLGTVRAGAADYVAGGGAAAAGKLAIVAAAYDVDPRSFGGVDLVAALADGVAADGSVGPYPSAFGSGLTLAGFGRAGVEAPAVLTTWLAGQQNADGGFGYAAGQPSDADNTALAILGLLADDSPAAAEVLDDAVAWARSARKADGSWAGWVPVNSTCILGSAMEAAGAGVPATRAFVTARQLDDGAITDGSGANVMATSQCGPLLGGVSYLDVEWTPAEEAASGGQATPGTTPQPTPSPATDAPSATVPTSPAGGADQTGGRGVPARTGADDPLPVAPVALGALALAALAAARRRA